MSEDPEDTRRPDPPSGRRRHPALDIRIPFFLPLWRRVATVGFLAVWTVIEFLNGNPFWGLLTGGLGAYAAYEFFITFDAEDFQSRDKE